MDLWTSWNLLFVLGIPDPRAHCFPAIAPYQPSLKDCQVYRDILCHLLSTISSTFFNDNGQLALWHRSKALLLATGWTQPTALPLEMFMFTTPDKASLKSETGGVMIMGFSLVTLKKWGSEKSRLIKDPVARDQVFCHSAQRTIFHRWRGPGDAFLPTFLLYTDCARACMCAMSDWHAKVLPCERVSSAL